VGNHTTGVVSVRIVMNSEFFELSRTDAKGEQFDDEYREGRKKGKRQSIGVCLPSGSKAW
jgi:hypothetical protein